MSNCIFYIKEYDMGATIEDCALRDDGNVYPTSLPKCDGCKNYRAFDDLKKQMQADFVAVVRCKDCKHSEVYYGDTWCNYLLESFGEKGDVRVDANWFCADGERKDNES